MSWQFANSDALWWILLPLLVVLLSVLRPRRTTGSGILPFPVLSHLPRSGQTLRWIFRALFLVFGLCLVALALCIGRPIERRSWTERTVEGIDIVISLDVSESMDADDFHPSRITVAKSVISDFVRKRKADRIGLNLFGGEAVTKSPLTRDHEFLLDQVKSVQLRELKQGTAIGMGLANAILRLKDSQAKTKIIVLITDGDSNVGAINPVTASHLARQENIKIYTIGMGEKNRVIIPIYQYDELGRRGPLLTRIPSYLNPALLKEIAFITGGKAYMARDSGMLNRILQEIDTLEKTKIKMLPREQQYERYWIPVALVSLLLFFVFVLQETWLRKGAKRNVIAV